MNAKSFYSLKGGPTNWGYVLILMVITILVAGGILSYAKFVFEEISSLSRLPEIEIEGKIKDETANWKIYTDDIQKYEVKYPKNWITSQTKTFRYFYPQIYQFPDEVFVTVVINPRSPSVSFKPEEKDLKKVFIGEKKFYWKEDKSNLEVKTLYYYTLNSDNSKIAELTLSAVKENKYLPVANIESIFNKMLSTFTLY